VRNTLGHGWTESGETSSIATALTLEPGAECVDGFSCATGENLDPPIGQVARMSRDAQSFRTDTGARPVEHALDATGDEAATCDQGGGDAFAVSARLRASTALVRASSAWSLALR
jgi:hypothetical protein